MNFDDTPQEAAFRTEAKAWIAANAPKQYEEELRKSSLGRTQLKGANILDVAKAWQKKKADAGWACLHWPRAYGGRGATPIERVIWQQEEGAFGKLSGMFIIGHGMCGPTMMAFAGEEEKKKYLPPLASGEKVWCQLFSEPAGGSDVAGLRTRAEKKGDDWIINGQKIWTSGAHYSDYGILLTRTDPNVAKHKGLTMFFLDMKSPGVEIKPIKQANGQSEFNEVYFTDVKIPDSQRLGAVNDGWNVSLTTLMNERMSIGAGMSTGFPELFEFCSNLMLEDGPAIDDRNVRSKLAHWAVRASGLKYTSMRAISALSKGERPGTGEFDRQAGRGIDDPGHRGLRARFAGRGRRAERTRGCGGHRKIPGDAAAGARHPRRRRHRRDHAQHHRRARARSARRYPGRQGRAVQQDTDQGTHIKPASS